MIQSSVKKFTLGFSPCPNDTFIFDALVNKKIDTGDLTFDVAMEDVQTLNNWAKEAKLDITKLSYGVLPLALNDYSVLNSGSALGSGVGPLLISLPGENITTNLFHSDVMQEKVIAIPGENTTAHLLFSLAFPKAKNKVFLRYDEIEDFVLSGKGVGVIIHENRFTYEKKGLQKIIDLGDFWQTKTGSPIPLGGIVVKRNMEMPLQQKIDNLIKQSIQYAFDKHPVLSDFIRLNAQEMSEEVMRMHIALYVNDYSLDLKEDGKKAIRQLLDVFYSMNKTPKTTSDIFVA